MPNVLTEATAELAVTLMLAAECRVAERDALARTGEWSRLRSVQLVGCPNPLRRRRRSARWAWRRARSRRGLNVYETEPDGRGSCASFQTPCSCLTSAQTPATRAMPMARLTAANGIAVIEVREARAPVV